MLVTKGQSYEFISYFTLLFAKKIKINTVEGIKNRKTFVRMPIYAIFALKFMIHEKVL